MALHLAKKIQLRGKSFLFIVYTKALKQYMKDGIAQIGLSENNVENYNQCFTWEKTENGDWVETSWKKWKELFDYIIVDEATDLSEKQIRFLMKRAKNLLFFGDDKQQLYAHKDSLFMSGIQKITDFPFEQLIYNYRLPKKIARFVKYINNVDPILEELCKNDKGNELPKILKYDSFEAELDFIAEIIENRNFEDVGILLPNNREVEKCFKYLEEEKGLTVEAKVNDNMNLDFNSDNPKIMTYHSSKGTQFEAVFLPGCTVSNIDHNNFDIKNLLYVAATRTYQSLYITYSGNLSSLFSPIPIDLYETRLITEYDEDDLPF